MPQIDPNSLRTLREQRRLSLEGLAKQSLVDRKTIHQIEKNKRRRTHPTTIRRLATALKVKEEDLINPIPKDDSPENPVDALLGRRRSQLNLRITDAKRNALSLVCWRYGVRAQEVVELAPFLFLWAAEASLRRRRENLAELSRRQSEVSELSSEFDHLDLNIVLDWRSEEIAQAEERSIADCDIFAEKIDNQCRGKGDSPMTQFLRGLAGDLGDLAEFLEWRSVWGPDYSICRDVALALVGGDEQAAEAILSGDAPLHELPKELRQQKEQVSERAEWVRQRAQATRVRQTGSARGSAPVGQEPFDIEGVIVMNLGLTRHSLERMGQRGISASDVELIMLIGSEVPDGYLVRSKDCRAMERRLQALTARIRRLNGKRVVIGDGHLITAYRAGSSMKRRLLRQAAERDLEIYHD